MPLLLRLERSMNKIANVENVICSAETMARHPEVYHYTKPGAFEGIISSRTLWCSHYREMICDEHKMADKNEIELAREPLITAYRAAHGCNHQER